jgi:N-acetylated-alpha-linked acidic dipeptidase
MQLLAGDEKAVASMADERTPLIQHVDIRPHRDRYPHHRLRFVCTTLLSGVVLIGGLVAVLLFSFGTFDDHPESTPVLKQSLLSDSSIPEGWLRKTALEYEELQSILLNTPDAEQARTWSQYYTSGPHLAGKNLSQALWTLERWQEFGIASSIVDYEVYINYPKGHRLALLEKNGEKQEASDSHATDKDDWEVTYEARLEENVLEEDKSSQLAARIPTFHGYSASGNVTAPYVFVNYGTYRDFEELQAANISLVGKIALAKYGGVFRGLKVKRAQELGMLGCVMYSDPGDDGEVTAENGVATYPDGPAREPSSVQRGSVQFLSMSHSSLAEIHITNTYQASPQATLPRPATHRSLVRLACLLTTRSQASPRSRSPMRMRSPSSKRSMATARKRPPSTAIGNKVDSDTRASSTTLGPRQTIWC